MKFEANSEIPSFFLWLFTGLVISTSELSSCFASFLKPFLACQGSIICASRIGWMLIEELNLLILNRKFLYLVFEN